MRMNDEQKKRAVELTLDGWTRIKIREQLGVSSQTWYRALDADPSFGHALARATAEALEDLADTLITIVDEMDDTYKAKVKSDNIKWILSKRKPSVYGDKLDVNVNQIVSLDAALLEARQRIRVVGDVEAPRQLVSSGDNSIYKDMQTDNKSVEVSTEASASDNGTDEDDIFS